VNEPLQFVSNVIELQPNKKYLLIFHGADDEAMQGAMDFLNGRGFHNIVGLSLGEGQSIDVIEAPGDAHIAAEEAQPDEVDSPFIGRA
jgi:hypothetical protein